MKCFTPNLMLTYGVSSFGGLLEIPCEYYVAHNAQVLPLDLQVQIS
jgi:hypothetical protein